MDGNNLPASGLAMRQATRQDGGRKYPQGQQAGLAGWQRHDSRHSGDDRQVRISRLPLVGRRGRSGTTPSTGARVAGGAGTEPLFEAAGSGSVAKTDRGLTLHWRNRALRRDGTIRHLGAAAMLTRPLSVANCSPALRPVAPSGALPDDGRGCWPPSAGFCSRGFRQARWWSTPPRALRATG